MAVGATGATFKGSRWQQVRQVVAGATGATFKGSRWQQVRQVAAGATGGCRCDRLKGI